MMTENIILVGENIFDDVKDQFLKFSKAKIFSLNYLSHKMLEKQNIDHEIGDQLLSDSDFSMIDNFTNNLTKNWFLNNDIQDKLKFESINLGSLIQPEFYQYLLDFVSQIVQVTKILENRTYDNVIAFTKINHFISELCNKNNISCRLIQSNHSTQLSLDNYKLKFNLFNIPLSIKISRKNYLKIKNIFEKIILKLKNKKNFDNNKKSILLFEFNIENYEDLLNSFSDLNKNILFLNTRRPTIWNFRTFKIMSDKKYSVINLQNFQQFTSTKISIESEKLKNKLKKLWNSKSLLNELFSFNSLTFWPDLENSFINICNERFSESISQILLFKEFLSRTNISTILLWAEPSPEEQELIGLAKSKKINIVYLQHAMAGMEDAFKPQGNLVSHLAHDSQCDKLAVWGEPAKKYGLTHNSTKNIFVTGSPRHDKFFNHNNFSQKKYVLFATTKPNPLFSKTLTTDSISNFLSFITETCTIFSNLPQKNLILKPHPTPVNTLDVVKIAEKIDSNISITYDSNVLKLLQNCEFLITTNNSTIALEAMMLNKPVISLQTESLALTENVAKYNALLSVSNKEDIKKSVETLFYDKKFKEELLKNAKNYLDDFFSNQGTSSKFLTKLINQD
ncbi:MAG: hypothetical protein CXT78_05380 [Thaumarchaeota archaeon]|nr:MAG: hypothetical protein CXT78_05380 [Nitrososphaerota archaeon]